MFFNDYERNIKKVSISILFVYMLHGGTYFYDSLLIYAGCLAGLKKLEKL